MKSLAAFLVFLSGSMLAACSCGELELGKTEDDELDNLGDSFDDAWFDVPTSDTPREELPPLPYVPSCGDGVLNEGEECDDRNRLNGDGCDWMCRLGNGDPPPEPDPDVSNYVPESDPVAIHEGNAPGTGFDRLPLVWTGSEFATSFCETPESGVHKINFRRFDETGEPVSADWTYPMVSFCYGTDIVWTGSGFGLFYAEPTAGIYFITLSAEGKPIGSPVLVEPDTQARAPAADLVPDGYILAWVSEGDEGWSFCIGGGNFRVMDTVRMRRVGWGGETEGDAVVIEDHAAGPPDIATGEGGFGMNVVVSGNDDWENCAPKFVKVSEDMSTIVPSGYLSNGVGGDVVFADGRYITAWAPYDEVPGEAVEYCFARFTMDGLLERPPVCNLVEGYVFAEPTPSRLAAGDGGLALLNVTNYFHLLFFLRTDFVGRAVAPPHDVMEGSSGLESFGGYGIAWADDGFGILFNWSNFLYFQRYRPAD